MNTRSNQNPEFFHHTNHPNLLWQYVQSLDQDVATRLSQPTPEAMQLMERNILDVLGNLPPGHFGVTITTTRESLSRLIASAMISGYFLHNAEQRMELEQKIGAMDDL